MAHGGINCFTEPILNNIMNADEHLQPTRQTRHSESSSSSCTSEDRSLLSPVYDKVTQVPLQRLESIPECKCDEPPSDTKLICVVIATVISLLINVTIPCVCYFELFHGKNETNEKPLGYEPQFQTYTTEKYAMCLQCESVVNENYFHAEMIEDRNYCCSGRLAPFAHLLKMLTMVKRLTSSRTRFSHTKDDTHRRSGDVVKLQDDMSLKIKKSGYYLICGTVTFKMIRESSEDPRVALQFNSRRQQASSWLTLFSRGVHLPTSVDVSYTPIHVHDIVYLEANSQIEFNTVASSANIYNDERLKIYTVSFLYS